jgi:hypothetical protein
MNFSNRKQKWYTIYCEVLDHNFIIIIIIIIIIWKIISGTKIMYIISINVEIGSKFRRNNKKTGFLCEK